MPTPESKVKARISKALKEAGAYYYMPVPGGYGAPSLDYIGSSRGRCFGIEAKAGNKKMTKRQSRTAGAMEAAGAQVFLVNDEEGLEELSLWLNSTTTTDGGFW